VAAIHELWVCDVFGLSHTYMYCVARLIDGPNRKKVYVYALFSITFAAVMRCDCIDHRRIRSSIIMCTGSNLLSPGKKNGRRKAGRHMVGWERQSPCM